MQESAARDEARDLDQPAPSSDPNPSPTAPKTGPAGVPCRPNLRVSTPHPTPAPAHHLRFLSSPPRLAATPSGGAIIIRGGGLARRNGSVAFRRQDSLLGGQILGRAVLDVLVPDGRCAGGRHEPSLESRFPHLAGGIIEGNGYAEKVHRVGKMRWSL